MPESPRYFKSRRDTQDAHEAIRPTYLDLPPDEVAKHVAADEAKLYRIIWERFVASQMAPAVYDTTVGRDHGGPCRLPRLGLDPEVRRLPRGLRRLGADPTEGRGGRGQGLAEAAAADAGRDARARRGLAGEEGDAAAAALQRGLARQVPRGERNRPPLDLRRDPAEDRGAPLRPPQGPPVHPDGSRPDRHRAPDSVLRRLLRDRLHGADGGGARRRRGGQALLDEGPDGFRQDLHPRPRPGARQDGLGQGRHSARRGEEAQALGRPRHGREVPQLRQEAEAPHGQERPLRRVQRLPELHVHAGHPRSRGRRRRHVGDREDARATSAASR